MTGRPVQIKHFGSHPPFSSSTQHRYSPCSPLTPTDDNHHRSQFHQHLVTQPGGLLHLDSIGPVRRQPHPAQRTTITAEDQPARLAPLE
jgi:hypothetical protein